MGVTNSSLVSSVPAAGFDSPERMLRGAGLVYVTTIVQVVGRLALSFMIGRVLGTEGFGVFSLAFVTTQALTMFATNGQDIVLLKFVTPAYQVGDRLTVRRMLDASLLTSLSFAFVLMLGMMILFPFFVSNATTMEQARVVAPWFAPAVMLQTVFGLLGSFALACGRVQVRAYAERVFGTAAQLVVTGTLLWLGWGLWAVAIGFIASALTTTAVMLFMSWDLIPRDIHVTERYKVMRQIFGHASKIGLSNAGNYMLSNVALFVLGTSNAAQAGLFAAASRLTLPGSLFMDAFGTNFTPRAAAKMNDPSLAHDFQQMTRWMITLSAPIFVLLFAFASQWMGLLGADFVSGTSVLMILAVARFLDMFTGNAGILISLSNRPGLRVLNTVVIWGTNLVLVLLLVPQYGVLGAALAYLSAIILTDVLESLEIGFFLRLSPWNKALLKPLFLIALSAVVLSILQAVWSPNVWQALGMSGLFLFMYALCAWVFALPLADKEMLKREVRRLSPRS